MTWQAACFSNQPDKFHQVFLPLHLDHIRSRINLFPDIISTDNIDTFLPGLKSIEVIFATWGMLSLSEEQLDQLPNLKVIFYAAGSTDYFSAPYLGRGVKIVSAWQANAIPVAEFCLAHILLGCKGYFRNQREYTAPDRFVSLSQHHPAPGNYQECVALIGAGAISQALQRLLQPFYLDVLVVPSRPERRTLTLEEAFSRAWVVSNHLPARPDNQGILNGELFYRMREGAVFINTGRGLQVNEPELIEVLLARPDLTAILDVTKPEPPVAGSLLYTLPNVQLTSHIAGSLNNETRRLVNYILDQFQQWLKAPECFNSGTK
ncbi:hydroxyacid dehydrogenase [Leclercia adecarboxylata]|uniref:hydroxyacid dehydrogenase n=1 Tax=Leclercia adecarboxylata TaxID=83655 RepID=UPI0022B7813E|nr:hydroxyacid dehydrogenase [Leclercia adecarboxylata]MCZ7840976.1 hydroxyacid dehydrogenase [Leclercia adecarboxylata]